MLIIRAEQMKAFEAVDREELIQRITLHLRQKFPGQLPGTEESQRRSVSAWIEDARQWGLRRPELIARYVESCAVTQGERPALETRLATYLRLYHESRVAGIDVEDFVKQVMGLAQRHQLGDEEAVSWLAVLLLGRGRGDAGESWIHEALGRPGPSEQARMRRLHAEAVRRGWVVEEGGE